MSRSILLSPDAQKTLPVIWTSSILDWKKCVSLKKKEKQNKRRMQTIKNFYCSDLRRKVCLLAPKTQNNWQIKLILKVQKTRISNFLSWFFACFHSYVMPKCNHYICSHLRGYFPFLLLFHDDPKIIYFQTDLFVWALRKFTSVSRGYDS